MRRWAYTLLSWESWEFPCRTGITTCGMYTFLRLNVLPYCGFTRGTQLWFLPKYTENAFQAVQSSFRSLETHFKGGYKNLYLFGHPRPGGGGNLSLFERASTSVLFSRKFQMQFKLKFYESENFSDSFLHQIFESENFKFPFSTKNSLTWGVKCERLNFRRNL